MAVQPIPPGYHTVTPYLVVLDGEATIKFLREAFDAREHHPIHRDDKGRIVHSEFKIGDSVIMLGEANEQYGPTPCGFVLYVPDTDATYRRALAAGATSLREPSDQFYGDRTAGVKDVAGNSWWISTHVEDVSPEEIERRSAAMHKK
jgi:uncharacterized glyoxalase superfamily protein PhnB